MGVIYKIINPKGRLYVGKTYDLRKRINSHRCASKKEETNVILWNSIKKYGWSAHRLEIIEKVSDEIMNEREVFWIAELKTYCYDYPGQMNMTKGGDGQRSTWMHDIERRKKQSERSKGEGNGFYGKTHTEESLKIMSQKAKERNKKDGRKVPEWGAEKGWNIVRKPVISYDVNGNFLCEYMSLTDAADKLKINKGSVNDSLNLNTWVGGKYFFRYKTENYPLKIDAPPVTYKTVKRPIYLLDDNLEAVGEFESAQEASDFFGIPKTTINRAAQYNDLNPIRLGHIFCYKDEYLEEYRIISKPSNIQNQAALKYGLLIKKNKPSQ